MTLGKILSGEINFSNIIFEISFALSYIKIKFKNIMNLSQIIRLIMRYMRSIKARFFRKVNDQ